MFLPCASLLPISSCSRPSAAWPCARLPGSRDTASARTALEAHAFANIAHVRVVAEVALVLERRRQVQCLASVDDMKAPHRTDARRIVRLGRHDPVEALDEQNGAGMRRISTGATGSPIRAASVMQKCSLATMNGACGLPDSGFRMCVLLSAPSTSATCSPRPAPAVCPDGRQSTGGPPSHTGNGIASRLRMRSVNSSADITRRSDSWAAGPVRSLRRPAGNSAHRPAPCRASGSNRKRCPSIADTSPRPRRAHAPRATDCR